MGLLFSKIGMAGGVAPVSANLIRITAASLAMGTLAVLQGRLAEDVRSLRDRPARWQILLGAMLGPVVGVVLSLFAVTRAPIGVASTLMSLSPVLLLPVSHFVFGERISHRAVAGTLAAVCGAALLFLFE